MLHPSKYRALYIVATTGSIAELYRQLLHALGTFMHWLSKAIMVQRIRDELHELVHNKKLKTVVIIDEVSLLRLEVFAELHTLTQFEKDSKPHPHRSGRPGKPCRQFDVSLIDAPCITDQRSQYNLKFS